MSIDLPTGQDSGRDTLFFCQRGANGFRALTHPGLQNATIEEERETKKKKEKSVFFFDLRNSNGLEKKAQIPLFESEEIGSLCNLLKLLPHGRKRHNVLGGAVSIEHSEPVQ